MFKAFADRLPQRLVAVFRGTNIFYHLTAALITYVLVMTGIDWHFYGATRGEYFTPLIFAAGIGGFFVPVFLPVGLYIAGELRKNTSLSVAGVASAQAVIIAWLISSFYKVFTGRIQPDFLVQTSAGDISHHFNFGILKNGIFWGWPSSHAAVACALATTLIMLYSDNRIVRYAAFLFAGVVSLGAAAGFHWLSDVVAGIIVGVLVGVVVVKDIRSKK